MMKKFALPLIIIAIIGGIYEYSKEQPNIFVVCIVIVVYMFGMMQLNAKIPSKFTDEEENKTNEND